MFGDFVAWFMQYLAGFTPNEEMPGAVNRNITLRIAPFPIHFTAEYCGTIVDYTRREKAVDLVLFCDQRVQFHSGKGASRLLPIGENRLHFDIQ